MHIPTIVLASTLSLAGAHAVGISSVNANRAREDAPAVRLVVAPTGNEVRYRVREKLMDVDFPSDAVGRTSAVQGGISLAADGSVISSSSKFVVQAATLKSDRSRRDRYLQNQTLETDTYATFDFVPTAFHGLPKPLPTSGTHDAQLVGNLTIHGVTKPVTWNVKATINGADVTGNATTSFTFDYFDLDQPNVPVVFSVDDKIVLEYDFHLTRPKS
jgi:polyisoprenoid-binding protein YceI